MEPNFSYNGSPSHVLPILITTGHSPAALALARVLSGESTSARFRNTMGKHLADDATGASIQLSAETS